MARTSSNMLPIGTLAPEFSLLNTVTDKTTNLHKLKGDKGTVVMFICNHCPFVIHVNPELINLANTYMGRGIGFIAISSNNATKYPQDSPKNMKIQALKEAYPFPYLYDESQDVAKAYDAACTPDFYVFNKSLKLSYRGQLDDSRSDNGIPLSGKDLRHALDCLIENKENTETQKPSIGCSIKWIS